MSVSIFSVKCVQDEIELILSQMERRDGSSRFIALHGSNSGDTLRTCSQSETLEILVVRCHSTNIRAMNTPAVAPSV